MIESGIYSWTNLKTGKVYIGQAVNLHIRKLQFLDKNLYNYAGSYINRARAKYKNSNIWEYKILKFCSKNRLNFYERFYIKKYKEDGYKLYNLTNGGDSLSGYKFSSESKIKMKISCRKSNTKKRTVIQLNLNGVFIAKYCSTRECEDLTGFKHERISAACRGKNHKSGHKAYNYLWFYENWDLDV